ncbi:hypothetical protein V6Z12_A05G142200 [Gossypium hirsutum]
MLGHHWLWLILSTVVFCYEMNESVFGQQQQEEKKKKRTLKEPHAKDEGIVAPTFETEEADTEPERRNSK